MIMCPFESISNCFLSENIVIALNNEIYNQQNRVNIVILRNFLIFCDSTLFNKKNREKKYNFKKPFETVFEQFNLLQARISEGKSGFLRL